MTAAVPNGRGPRRSTYDVVVVGAGPAGSVAAIAHAARGASVLLLEADPRAATRFAGEWLHTTGVDVLDRLRVGRLDEAQARPGYGFVILPDDGSEPVEMPYGQGVALVGEHCGVVESLREAARDRYGVEVLSRARVAEVDDDRVRVEDGHSGSAFEVRAGRIVGADGRRSTVRRSLGFPDGSQPLSFMAAVELRGVTLPREGFGHLFLGGPGPALFYRISDDVVRGCLDVPIGYGARARSPQFLWDGFGPVMTPELRPALRASLERGSTRWAVNRFRPRTAFGGGRSALVGDAVGHVHPMTAIGMTNGLLDAYALAQADRLEDYAKARRAYVPELLSNALYYCFRRDDPGATALRQAMFETLQADPDERRRTMDILAGHDSRSWTFGSSFLRIAGRALVRTLGETSSPGGLERLPRNVAGLWEWMQWPAALAVPALLDHRVRARSTPTRPIPQLESWLPPAPEPAELPDVERADGEPPLASGIEAGAARLLTELEQIAARVGTVPDAALAGPALSSMRAILTRDMGVGMAARMTLGRRRLAFDGFPRLLAGSPGCRHLAELMLVLLDGAPWEDAAIEKLAEGVRALLDCQAPDGGFARDRDAAAREGAADLELTALACRALGVLARRRPSATEADLDRTLERAARWVRAQQADDGSWEGDVSASAWAVEALLSARVPSSDPAVRRAARWLASVLEGAAAVDGPAGVARALRALVSSGAPRSDTILRAARDLAARMRSGELDDDVEAVREAVQALAACEARRAAQPRPVRRRSHRRGRRERSPVDAARKADWAYCRTSLEEVSRTFARPIQLLPPKLEVAVTLGYLLCRIADTIEDHVAVSREARDELFRVFLDVLEAGRDPEDFAEAFDGVDRAEGAVEGADDAERLLARSLPRVMHVFEVLDPGAQEALVRWVTEMSRGMNLYGHRRPGPDGVAALHTVSDLERYCYYVAGTVGHLLTDLFVAAIDEDPEGPIGVAMRDHAEGFASGLQLTNILKDVTDDLARGVSFVPRSECARHGLLVADLVEPTLRERAHAAVAPLFDLARERLDEALEYTLLVPGEHRQIRLFCLLPLWMAARTLTLARGHDAMFTPDAPVKITRGEVEALIAECMVLAEDDDTIRARYAVLYDTGPLPALASSSRAS